MLKKIAFTIGLCALVLIPVAASAQNPATNDPDMKELLAYRLTLPTLDKVVQATKNMAAAAKSDPRFIKHAALEKEIKTLEQKEERTDADEARLEKLKEELEQADEKLNFSENTKTLSDMAAAIEKEPLAAKALADAGMSAREYSKFALAYFQAAMVAGMMKQGMIKEVPAELKATVNMDNVKFVQEHEAELEAFGKAMKSIEGQ
jgi:hypothetical protein